MKKEKKSESVNIRITPYQKKIIEENGLSPTEIFNKMLNKDLLEKRKKIAKENLQKYPQIKSLFQEEWAIKQIDALKLNSEDGVNGHGLAWMLSNHISNKFLNYFEETKKKAKNGDISAWIDLRILGGTLYEPLLKLGDLEKNLDTLKDEKKIIRTIKKAKNHDQFWKTLSEIEVAAKFKNKRFLKELEPSVNGKTPDSLIILNKKEFCVEVFTPDLAQKLEQSIGTGKVITLENRAWDKLSEKIHQLPKEKPGIIVINKAFSEIDSINITNAIIGSSAVQISKDPKINTKIIRKKDGLIYTQDLNNLKAIVIYKRVIDLKDGLITIAEVKRVLSGDGKDMTEKQEKMLEDVFKSMTFRNPLI